MEGDPAPDRDDPSVLKETEPDASAPPRARSGWFLTAFSVAFGLAVAAAAVLRSDILSQPRQENFDTWPLSAATIALISACWIAGFIHLLRLVLTSGSASRPVWSAGQSWLIAFALGPLLVALLFSGAEIARSQALWMIVYLAIAGIVVVLVYARARVRLFAERLLVSFFLWLAILFALTFWRDPVSDQLALLMFRMLKLAGLLT